jgi:hypothetical protein
MSLQLDELARRATEAFETSLEAQAYTDSLSVDAGHWIQRARKQFTSHQEHRTLVAKHVLIPEAAICVTELVVLGVVVAAGIEVRGDMVVVSYAQASAMRHGRRERTRHDS